MLGSALRALAIWAILTAAATVAAVFHGRMTGLIALLALAVVPAFLWLWLPRVAHSAFRRGDYARGRLWYRVLRLTSISSHSRAAIDVSLAACGLAAEDFEYALRMLARVDQHALGDAARAAWLNNRAYALARGSDDAEAALACSDQAIALRPDVAGFRHTRGVALLALGRVDEAINELERLWDSLAVQSTPAHALLEAERCYDLGVAWREKGEPDYAADYFMRAHQTSPNSRWARRAAGHLEHDEPPGLGDW